MKTIQEMLNEYRAYSAGVEAAKPKVEPIDPEFEEGKADAEARNRGEALFAKAEPVARLAFTADEEYELGKAAADARFRALQQGGGR